MATVYSGIQGFEQKAPVLTDFKIAGSYDFDFDAYELANTAYLNDITAFCKSNSTCPHAGCLLRFPNADGYAQYVVLNYESLVHIDLEDGYFIPEAHAKGLDKSDIINHIEANKKWDAFIAS